MVVFFQSFLVILFLFSAGVIDLFADFSVPVGSIQEKPGVAIVKPQPWSRSDQATVLPFQAVSNHTGYYQFRTKKSPVYQVVSTKVLAVIVFPGSPASLTSVNERLALQNVIDELVGVSKLYPASAPFLNQTLSQLKSDAAQYDAGNIKEQGSWEPRRVYIQKQASALADLIKSTILSTPQIKDFNLTANPHFILLQELAGSESSAHSVLTEIQSFCEGLVRQNKRKDLLQKLKVENMSAIQVSELIQTLKTLSPEEDSEANRFVQISQKAEELSKQIYLLQDECETSMAQVSDSSRLPEMTPELAASIQKTSTQVRLFREDSLAGLIPVPLPLADALLSFGAHISILKKQVDDRQIFEAKSLLDTLVGQAGLIGPNTLASLAGVQKQINDDVNRFILLRDEAKMLIDNHQIEEARKKYQQAYDVIPAKDILIQMEMLVSPLSSGNE